MSAKCFVLVLALATFEADSLMGQARQVELPMNLTAIALSTGGMRTPAVASRVDITINRWSTASESERLIGVLKQQGADRLLDALHDAKSVGTIRTPGNLAYDLRYASVEPGEDGGLRIFLATDRPVSYWEAVNRPRVSDYPFTFIELRLNGRGEGEGKLALATRIIDRGGKTIELENYDGQPISLNEVRRTGR